MCRPSLRCVMVIAVSILTFILLGLVYCEVGSRPSDNWCGAARSVLLSLS